MSKDNPGRSADYQLIILSYLLLANLDLSLVLGMHFKVALYTINRSHGVAIT